MAEQRTIEQIAVELRSSFLRNRPELEAALRETGRPSSWLGGWDSKLERLLRLATEPPVLGAGAGHAPMPTPEDAINAHVRQIQIICDAANLDPTEWLNDETA